MYRQDANLVLKDVFVMILGVTDKENGLFAIHDKVSDFWLRVNRANDEYPGVIRYVDAVEVCLCFGWIDSTQKRIDDGKPVQHFTPRRKGCNWSDFGRLENY